MATAQAESTIPAGTWQSDQIHSSIGFRPSSTWLGTFRGTFQGVRWRASAMPPAASEDLRAARRWQSVQVTGREPLRTSPLA